jgi:SAM-dependent methyltransferase
MEDAEEYASVGALLFGEGAEREVERVGAVQVSCVHAENQHTYLQGQVVWPSAVALVEWAAAHVELFHGAAVLELGSGTGACGLALAQHCGAMVLTDYEPAVLELLRENMVRNASHTGGAVEVARLAWGDAEGAESVAGGLPAEFWARCPAVGAEGFAGFDALIGTDVVYDGAVVPALLASAHALLRPGGRFYLANGRVRYANLADAVSSHAARLGLLEQIMPPLAARGSAVEFRVLTRRA